MRRLADASFKEYEFPTRLRDAGTKISEEFASASRQDFLSRTFRGKISVI